MVALCAVSVKSFGREYTRLKMAFGAIQKLWYSATLPYLFSL